MKFVKHDFEIMVDPKGTLNGATLGFGFENPFSAENGVRGPQKFFTDLNQNSTSNISGGF